MTNPIRIQRKRAKGWRMPENTIYVGRPSFHANPYQVGKQSLTVDGHVCEPMDLMQVLGFYEEYAHTLYAKFPEMLAALKGKNLACWCQIGQPCHADLLLKLANQPQEETP